MVLLSPPDALKASNAPMAEFIGRFWGSGAAMAVAAFAAISAFGALNGWVLLQGEMPYAMAKGGVFPPFLAKSSSRGTPVRAHLVSGVFLTALVAINYAKSMADLFTFIALLATTASLFTYLACVLAALRLQAKGLVPGSRLLSVVAILAGIYAVFTLFGAGKEAVMWGLVLLAAGLPVHLLMRRTALA